MNRTAARMLWLGVPLAVLVLGVGVAAELVVERTERKLLESRQDSGLDLAANAFTTEMAAVDSDLAVVASLDEIVPALDPKDADARARLGHAFLTFARAKRTYEQVRLLGPDGRERVRVNYREGRGTLVPDAELQDKGDRPYFREAIALEPGAVYVSPIDLNVERGVVSEPRTPMVRLATPVVDTATGARGIVVLNYLARHALDGLERAVIWNAGRVVLVDEAGFFLRGRTPEEEWGGQLPGRSASRFGIAFPVAWKVVSSEERGTVRTARGLFAFRTVRRSSFLGRPGGGGGPWKVVSVISAPEVRSVERRFLWVVLAAAGIVLILMGAAFFVVSKRQVRVEETEQRAFGNLREAEERYRLLFERNQTGVYRSTLDGKLLECNEAFLKLFGFETREEALERRTTSFYADVRDRARVIDRLLTERKPVSDEILFRRRDGSTHWLLASVTLVAGLDGSPSLIEGALVDVDERRRAEEALRSSEARTRALLENMLGGLLMVNDRGVIEFVNPAAERMFGYESDELIGQPLLALVPERKDSDVGAFLRESLGKAMGRVSEWEGRRKNGEVFSFELALFQFETPEGRRIAGSLVDVTERREVERLKREFVSSISHELRTPLTSIRGSLGLLAGGVLGPLSPDATEVVAVAERNVVRLISLINDILDLERLEGGRLEMEFESSAAATIVERSLEAVRGFAAQASVRLIIDPVSVSASVRADADRLVQVLVNLVSNAVKFSPASGTVTVRVVLAPGMAEFQVEDEGRGVPPALREAIFERYRQVEASDSRRKGGAGLGLAICKAIVEQHGGAIGVRDAAGAGSLFWFRIPLVSTHRSSISGSVRSARGLALLVDDDEELLAILELRLAQDGVATQRAMSAREAIAAAHAVKPDILVLDLGLPDGNGSQVVEALRRDKTLRDLPLLVYTGRDLLQSERDELVLGPTRFLTKSRETDDEFRTTVLELLASGREEKT
ncbi:MAG: PAS domain S-box protein [Acidobacteriota bacterium]|nr:PAS domain S-box protein [Acidobacteriota bacterium]